MPGKKPKPTASTVAASLTLSANPIQNGGTLTVGWAGDGEELYVAVTLNADATTVLSADFIASGYTGAIYDVFKVVKDRIGFFATSVSFVVSGSEPGQSGWVSGGATGSVSLKSATYTAQGDRQWTTLAEVPLTVTS